MSFKYIDFIFSTEAIPTEAIPKASAKPGNKKRKRRIVEEEEEARWNLFSEI